MARSKRPKPKLPMYTPKQRMFYEPCKCDPKGRPIGDADEAKLKGGYKTGKDNRCPVHNFVLTRNKICTICELDT